MTAYEPYPPVNPGWVDNTATTPAETLPPEQASSTSASSIPPNLNAEAPVQELEVPEDELQLLKRVGYSYQVLASAIVRAKQAQQDLRVKQNFYKDEIATRQQELQTVLAQFAEHQTNPQTMPANEDEITAEFAELKELLKGTHHESLLLKLNQMQSAVDSDRNQLPELLTSMRSELDLVILQALRLTALESLNDAYKKYRQFQEYNSRADQEFQSLVKAFAVS